MHKKHSFQHFIPEESLPVVYDNDLTGVVYDHHLPHVQVWIVSFDMIAMVSARALEPVGMSTVRKLVTSKGSRRDKIGNTTLS